MSIVILKWNPAFSSYTMARFLGDLEKCALANDGNVGMNWSIWDWEKVHAGDTFFMLKVGYGQTGIVARGTITSEPYSGEDWSWQNRPTKYCNFDYDIMINPDAYPILNSAELKQFIPDFDWTGGHSGLVLTEQQGEDLQRLWSLYLQRQSQYFEKASDQNLFILSQPLSADGIPYKIELEENYGNDYMIIITHLEDGVKSRLRIFNYYRVLGKFGVKSWRALQQLLFRNYPTTSSLQTLCGDLLKCQIDFSADFVKHDPEEEEEEED